MIVHDPDFLCISYNLIHLDPLPSILRRHPLRNPTIPHGLIIIIPILSLYQNHMPPEPQPFVRDARLAEMQAINSRFEVRVRALDGHGPKVEVAHGVGCWTEVMV